MTIQKSRLPSFNEHSFRTEADGNETKQSHKDGVFRRGMGECVLSSTVSLTHIFTDTSHVSLSAGSFILYPLHKTMRNVLKELESQRIS